MGVSIFVVGFAIDARILTRWISTGFGALDAVRPAFLALLLMVGGVIGAQFGAVAGEKLKGEQLRFLLAGLVVAVCIKMAWGLIGEPTELYSIGPAFNGGGD